MLRRFAKIVAPALVWDIPTESPALYLTFDDGPVPQATPYVLDTLKQFNAKATFFCVGENVDRHPAIFKRIKEEGHAVGNHTYHHINGWKTSNRLYKEDVAQADGLIHSTLFRPPYGKLKLPQISDLKSHYSIIMWDVLTKDYDRSMTGEQCFQRVLKKAHTGSIVVFHDSVKAFDRLCLALPKTLEHFSEKGFSFKRIPL